LRKESGEAEEALRQLAKADSAYQKKRHHRAKKHEGYCQEANEIKENVELLVTVYRDANIGVRHEFPECFKQPAMTVAIPPPLSSLDWECEEVASV
jgi:hypothetical protein